VLPERKPLGVLSHCREAEGRERRAIESGGRTALDLASRVTDAIAIGTVGGPVLVLIHIARTNLRNGARTDATTVRIGTVGEAILIVVLIIITACLRGGSPGTIRRRGAALEEVSQEVDGIGEIQAVITVHVPVSKNGDAPFTLCPAATGAIRRRGATLEEVGQKVDGIGEIQAVITVHVPVSKDGNAPRPMFTLSNRREDQAGTGEQPYNEKPFHTSNLQSYTNNHT
jgi:hypothetical protein